MHVKEAIDLHGHVALVTGGTGWLGAEISNALAELGADVIAISRGQSKEFPVLAQASIEHSGGVSVKHVDLSKKENIDALVDNILGRYGKIDILVNNSYTWPKTVKFEETTWEQLTDTFSTGVVAQLYLTKRVLSSMRAQKKGSIVNVASMYGSVAPDHSIYRDSNKGNAIEYGASKAAMVQATRYLAAIAGKDGVRCNSISPGPFPRPGTFDDGNAWFEQELSKKTMLGRVADAKEIKGVIAFLASDMSSYITGADIPIDGGWTAW